MVEREVLLAELGDVRERAVSLLRAKLEAVASQLRESAARISSDLQVVLPPDLEMLFPLVSLADKFAAAAPPPAVHAALDLAALRLLDAGRAQSEVLQQLLAQLEPCCQQRAVVVFREGQISGWSGAGFASNDVVPRWKAPLADSPMLKLAAEGQPTAGSGAVDTVLAGWFGSEADLVAVPMSLRGKVVGALVASGSAHFEHAQVLTFVTGLLLETLAVRPALPTPALRDLEVVAARVKVESAGVDFAMPVEELAASVAAAVVPDGSETVQLKTPVMPVMPMRSAEDERKHEEARRFARLLVSEIRLYNEQAVQEGRTTKDIYPRLKEDIDRSREMFEQRITPEVRASGNYFYEELVRILGDGDPNALGL